VTGEDVNAAEIAARASAGDAHAAATLERWVARLGRGLAVVVNVLDPEVVVLGGGLSNIPDLPERAREALAPHVFSPEVAARIACNRHGDSSGVRGAAWLWSEREAVEASARR
jgi:fructokinase